MSAVLVRCDRRRRPLAPVPDEVAEALTGLLAGHTDERAAMVARRFLDELRIGGQWLMCTCRDGKHPPMLFPCRRSDSGTLFVRREVGVAHARTASGIASPSTANRPTR